MLILFSYLSVQSIFVELINTLVQYKKNSTPYKRIYLFDSLFWNTACWALYSGQVKQEGSACTSRIGSFHGTLNSTWSFTIRKFQTKLLLSGNLNKQHFSLRLPRVS